ncbi:MAG: helix-turn-helix transcriptional regulator [Proteobacteria bacterium]|nr:helix-turn-helix transcriptional regulator [Pseudomonadota bacterium]
MAISLQFIRNVRTKFNLTQEEFGKKIGYSRSYVRDIELGKVQPSRLFLEKISNEFHVSIDSLLSFDPILNAIELSIDPILNAIDRSRGHENPNIPFLMGFTQEELDSIEEHLKIILDGRDTRFIDASELKTKNQLYEKITGINGNITILRKALSTILINSENEIMIVIKALSLSKISAGHVRDIFKTMDDAWKMRKEGEEVIVNHAKPKSCLILIDFPSFLEKNHSKIGYYAIPIYPNFLQKKDIIVKEQIYRKNTILPGS